MKNTITHTDHGRPCQGGWVPKADERCVNVATVYAFDDFYEGHGDYYCDRCAKAHDLMVVDRRADRKETT